MVSIKKTYAFGDNDGDSRKTISKIMVLHSTADTNATATNIAAYFKNNWIKTETYVHYSVDDKEAQLIGTPGYVAWGAGNVNLYAPVQIELCEFTDRTRALKAYANCIALITQLCKTWGINRDYNSGNKTNGVKSHKWCAQVYGGSDHTDPVGYLASIGISETQLAADIKAGKTGVKVTSTTASKPASKPATKPAKTSTASHSGVWFQVPAGATAERGKYINGDTEIKVRYDSPSTHAPAVADALPPFGTFEYDSFRKTEGYTWIHHMYQDRNIWVPVRIWHGNSSTPYGTFK